jgi:hypothetical protein
MLGHQVAAGNLHTKFDNFIIINKIHCVWTFKSLYKLKYINISIQISTSQKTYPFLHFKNQSFNFLTEINVFTAILKGSP